MEALASGSLSLRTTRSHHQPQKKKMSPPSPPQENSGAFQVSGVHALLFDDDTLAAFVNSPTALLPWNGDPSLLIDRYDVRHLLQDLSGIRRRRPAPPLVDVTEQELNFERYRDLEDTHNSHHHQADSHQLVEETPSSTSGSYQAVPFSYSSGVTTCEKATETTLKRTNFVPPFPVPEFLHSKLPDSEKQHQIIVGTAKFVTEHGGQSEFLLKVKQGDNPMFGFLNNDHQLHEYYRYLLRHPDLLRPASQSKSISVSAGEGLSLLGSAYGTGDDDNDDEGKECVTGPKEDLKYVPTAPVDQGKAKERLGGTSITKGSSVLATSSSRLPKGLEMKASKLGAVNDSGQHEKKPKLFVGSKDYSQPDKNIIAQPNNSKINNVLDRDSKSFISSRLTGRFEPRGTWQTVPNREYGMSADAAAAAVFAATRGARGLKYDSAFNRPSGLTGRTDASEGGQVATLLADSRGSLPNDAKTLAQAVAVAVTSKADSSDPILTAAEKLRAERLRRAKMFAAMIKSGKSLPEVEAQLTAIPAAGESFGNGSDRNGEISAGGQFSEQIHKKNEDASHTANGNSSLKEADNSSTKKALETVICIEEKQANHGSRAHDKTKKSHHRRRKHSRSDSDQDVSSRKKRSHHRSDRKKHKNDKQKRQESDLSDNDRSDSGRNRRASEDDTLDKRSSKHHHESMEKHQPHSDRGHENYPSESEHERKHKKHRSRDHSTSKYEKKHRKHATKGQSDSEDGGKRVDHRSRHESDSDGKRERKKHLKSDSDDKRERKKHRSSEFSDNENGKRRFQDPGNEKKIKDYSESKDELMERKATDPKRQEKDQVPEKEEARNSTSQAKVANPESDRSRVTLDVPAEIRAKVREMLLSTL